MDKVNAVISADEYRILFDAIKGFRNGLAYGIKVRTPHAIMMNVLWSRTNVTDMSKKVYHAVKTHSTKLAYFAIVYKLVLAILRKYTPAGNAEWPTLVVGALCGGLFFGEDEAIVNQVNTYCLTRISSGFLFILLEKYNIKISKVGLKVYAAIIWGIMMWMSTYHGHQMQKTVKSSMDYIYRESDVHPDLTSLIVRSSAKNI